MASLYGTNATLRNAVPSSKVGVGEQLGRVHVLYDEYVTTAAPSNDDTIDMFIIPIGFRVLEVGLANADMGDSGTVEFGWAVSSDAVEAADPNGFLASIDVTTAANVVLMSSYANLAGQCKKFEAQVTTQIYVTDAWTASSGTISVWAIGMVC